MGKKNRNKHYTVDSNGWWTPQKKDGATGRPQQSQQLRQLHAQSEQIQQQLAALTGGGNRKGAGSSKSS